MERWRTPPRLARLPQVVPQLVQQRLEHRRVVPAALGGQEVHGSGAGGVSGAGDGYGGYSKSECAQLAADELDKARLTVKTTSCTRIIT